MTDREIISLFEKRNEKAIAEVTRKYGDYCYSVAVRILGSALDAEECVNDTWLAVWNKIPPEKPENLGAYLARITHHIAVARLRRISADRRGGGEIELVFEELDECLPDRADAESPLLAKELASAMNRFYGTLPKRTRDIFIARYYSARPFDEIADAYGTSEANVRLLLSRTRKKLRAYLEKEGLI